MEFRVVNVHVQKHIYLHLKFSFYRQIRYFQMNYLLIEAA